jgi:hypothetical protein
VYYYRVVYCEGGHFTGAKPDQVLPRDIIQPTAPQIQAIDEIIKALAVKDREEAELALKHAIRRLYLALICHTVSSVPFKSGSAIIPNFRYRYRIDARIVRYRYLSIKNRFLSANYIIYPSLSKNTK